MSAIKDEVLKAVDALAVELGIGKDGLAFTWDQLERINAILAAYAHELAEKQRAFARQEDGLLNTERAKGYVNGVHHAADLIDPEVTE